MEQCPISRLSTVRNFRDVGGARTQDGRRFTKGLVFRSGLLTDISAEDRAILEQDLGLRAIVDVRRRREHATHDKARFRQATVYHVPLTPGDVRVLVDPKNTYDSVVAWYWRQLDVGSPAIREIFNLISQVGHEPTVIHCHAGKDRTGVLSAVVLGALRVLDQDIIEDYTRSTASEDDTWFDPLPGVFREASAAVMEALLRRVREEYGSMREYVRSTGVTDEILRRLEDRYLMPDEKITRAAGRGWGDPERMAEGTSK